ncbi:helix-turn-helix domain-containing protein [Solihabitans fulvus]|uniref:Helix-turn-helix domain-containing protein n=1 Tax=Solihabitans fulvus TaxID=1892852 RepID=A0A5B2WVW5_9PSEU|nr:transcriptional regulator [Solihabitans fulvus]KAA2254057.1 helix-turn-helix domain-containing protein [Solihabitans fulvus]
MPGQPDRDRNATVEELRALGHPLRWRILRLCLDSARTNQELAQRLGVAPATVLRHVRVLVRTGFLAAEPVRTGARGALERPYRATKRTWGLGVIDFEQPELSRQVDLAMLAAHRAELIEAGPEASRDGARGTLRLGAESQAELRERMVELISEFADRNEAGGEPLSYLWSLIAREPDTHGDRQG